MRILFLISISLLFSTSQSILIEDIERFIKLIQNILKPFEILNSNDPYANLTIDEFVNVNGYPFETHEVTTDDGYILTLHRIPYGRNGNSSSSTPRPVIVFKCGVASSAWDFIYLGQNKSLAMLFADLGYDIWLVNTRGDRYSMKHQVFNSSIHSKEFWNFSFHEKGHYDLPASIDFITNITNTNNVSLITHSQGTIEGLVLLATRPESQDKVNLLVLFSPVVYLSNAKSPLIVLPYKFRTVLLEIVELLKIEGVPFNSAVASIMKEICSTKSFLQGACLALIQEASGPDYDNFNKSMLSFFMANYPDGISIKEFKHYAQEIESGEFKQYDYGIDNLIHYNNSVPPSYNISSIKTPIAAYYGQNDYVTSLNDVDKFLKQVPNLVVSKLIDYKLFNHIDFIWAINSKEVLYNDVIEQIQKYNPIN